MRNFVWWCLLTCKNGKLTKKSETENWKTWKLSHIVALNTFLNISTCRFSIKIPLTFHKISLHCLFATGRSQISNIAVCLFSGLLHNCVNPRWRHTWFAKYGRIKTFTRHCPLTVILWVYNLFHEVLSMAIYYFLLRFFSVSNLLRAGAISEPLWFPVVQAFPPLTETKINRKGDEELMHKITYPEDEIRK